MTNRVWVMMRLTVDWRQMCTGFLPDFGCLFFVGVSNLAYVARKRRGNLDSAAANISPAPPHTTAVQARSQHLSHVMQVFLGHRIPRRYSRRYVPLRILWSFFLRVHVEKYRSSTSLGRTRINMLTPAFNSKMPDHSHQERTYQSFLYHHTV